MSMQKLIAVSLIFAVVCSALGSSVSAQVSVRGYVRKDGTYVAPHYRSHPDGNPHNNWSTKGNVNPYTGEVGTKSVPAEGARVISGLGTSDGGPIDATPVESKPSQNILLTDPVDGGATSGTNDHTYNKSLASTAIKLEDIDIPASIDECGERVVELELRIRQLEERIQHLETEPDSSISTNAGAMNIVPVGLEAWRKIANGMTPEQVLQLLGQPRRRDSTSGTEYWYYSDYGKVQFNNARVYAFNEPSK